MLFEKIHIYIQESKFSLILLKVLTYSFYVGYLALSGNLNIALIVTPAIFLFYNFSYRIKLLLMCIFAVLDFKFAFNSKNLFSRLNFIDDFINTTGDITYSYLSPVIIILAIGGIYFLAQILLKLRNVKTYLQIPFFFFVLYLFNYIFIKFEGKYDVTSFFINGIITYIASKIWVIYLLAIELKFKKTDTLDLIGGVAFPLVFFRETFNLSGYEEQDREVQSRLYLKACLISIGAILGYFVVAQTLYQFSSFENTISIANKFAVKLECSQASSYSASKLISMTRLNAWACFFSSNFLVGFVKVYLLNSLVMVLPMLLLGFNLSLPFSNVLRARSWSSFFSSLFYYYSLIVNRVFVTEIYKFFLDISKKRNEIIRFASTFIGVILCGYCYHMFRDFSLLYKNLKVNIFDLIFRVPVLIYFESLAFLSAFSGLRFFNKTKLTNKLGVLEPFFYVFIFILMRIFFSNYQLGIPVENQYNYILKLLY